MNVPGILFFFFTAFLLFVVPRRWAPVPLLIGCCYMTMGQGIELGPASLPMYRMLLAVGLLRVLMKGESAIGWPNSIDKLMIALGVWMMIASLFHKFEEGSGPVHSAGVIFNVALAYYLIRVFCRDIDEVRDIVKVVAVILMPVAIAMLIEKITAQNPFAVFGGIRETVLARNGELRAQGPFRHPILAGTVGATCVPLIVGIFSRYPFRAFMGLVACLTMIFTSSSSGPVISMAVGVGAVMMWRFRDLTRFARWTAAFMYLALAVVMNRPVYYLIGDIDLAGGSTGWHRAHLIEKSFVYISEWWLFGTDQTRHWMPNQGIAWSTSHTDITNYYIGFGVLAGLPAMFLVIAMLWRAFRWVGDSVRMFDHEEAFMTWCLGAGLFAHAATALSVGYFDQSLVFFWLNIAVISSLRSLVLVSAPQYIDPAASFAGFNDQPPRTRA